MTEFGVVRSRYLSEFMCTGAACPDTCCAGNWVIQVEGPICEKYKKEAPELLDVLEDKGGIIGQTMRRKPGTNACVKLEEGLCGIHAKYSESYLSDMCYFYPRSTKKIGVIPMMTGVLSCPEIVRLALFDAEDPFALDAVNLPRKPIQIKDYLPEGADAGSALEANQLVVAFAGAQPAPELAIVRLMALAQVLDMQNPLEWTRVMPVYFPMLDSRVPAPETDVRDPFFLLIMLATLIQAAHSAPSERLQKTLQTIEQTLACSLRWEEATVDTSADSFARYEAVVRAWKDLHGSHYNTVLTRYIQAELQYTLFPYAGLGNKPSARMVIIGIRFALIRLGLACACYAHGGTLPQDEAIRIVQSLSRVVDHLLSADVSEQLYKEAGWDKIARFRGLMHI